MLYNRTCINSYYEHISYNPSLWNNSLYTELNNCFTYALGIQVYDISNLDAWTLQPGYLSRGYSYDSIHDTEFLSFVLDDFISLNQYPVKVDSFLHPLKEEEKIIQLLIDDINHDYHFLRKDYGSDKIYHKLGHSNVTEVDYTEIRSYNKSLGFYLIMKGRDDYGRF